MGEKKRSYWNYRVDKETEERYGKPTKEQLLRAWRLYTGLCIDLERETISLPLDIISAKLLETPYAYPYRYANKCILYLKPRDALLMKRTILRYARVDKHHDDLIIYSEYSDWTIDEKYIEDITSNEELLQQIIECGKDCPDDLYEKIIAWAEKSKTDLPPQQRDK